MSTPVNMLRKIAGIIGARPAQALSQPVKKSAQSVAKIVPITFRLSGSNITDSNGQIPPAQKSINWTIFIQLIRRHLRYDCDYKN